MPAGGPWLPGSERSLFWGPPWGLLRLPSPRVSQGRLPSRDAAGLEGGLSQWHVFCFHFFEIELTGNIICFRCVT